MYREYTIKRIGTFPRRYSIEPIEDGQTKIKGIVVFGYTGMRKYLKENIRGGSVPDYHKVPHYDAYLFILAEDSIAKEDLKEYVDDMTGAFMKFIEKDPNRFTSYSTVQISGRELSKLTLLLYVIAVLILLSAFAFLIAFPLVIIISIWGLALFIGLLIGRK